MRADTGGRAVAAARNSRLKLVLIVPGKRQGQIIWPGPRLSRLRGLRASSTGTKEVGICALVAPVPGEGAPIRLCRESPFVETARTLFLPRKKPWIGPGHRRFLRRKGEEAARFKLTCA
jgi:hypothetical protein